MRLDEVMAVCSSVEQSKKFLRAVNASCDKKHQTAVSVNVQKMTKINYKNLDEAIW